jgi:hypothetical protein
MKNNSEIIQAQGEVQMIKRDWWQLYKRGWQKHRDFWNRRWWIRFKWDAESNVPQHSHNPLTLNT